MGLDTLFVDSAHLQEVVFRHWDLYNEGLSPIYVDCWHSQNIGLLVSILGL